MKYMKLDRVQSLYLFHSIISILSFLFPLYRRYSSFLCIFIPSVKTFYSNRCSNQLCFGELFVFTSILLLDLFCQIIFKILP